MRFLLAILALACMQGAAAQAIDERWIVERVVAGRYEELRAVKAESDKGSPVAMYWWGTFLDACLYERCDSEAAQALWMRAAMGGYGYARTAILAAAQAPEEIEVLVKRLGAPASLEEKLAFAYVMAALSVSGGSKNSDVWEKSRAMLRELAADRRLAAIFAVGGMEGFKPYQKELRAMVEAGFSAASEKYRQWLLVSERGEYPQLLARARSGDLVAGAALCETVGITNGYEQLPGDLLKVCEQAVLQGHTGVLPVLLVHHHASKNAKAAAFYADLCGRLAPLKCASNLADYHHDNTGKTPAWELWDILAVSGAMPWSEMGKPPALLRQAFSVRTRWQQMERACLLRRYDPATEKFEDELRCEWRRPIAIPAEHLSR